jgi:hypothetical protein
MVDRQTAEPRMVELLCAKPRVVDRRTADTRVSVTHEDVFDLDAGLDVMSFIPDSLPSSPRNAAMFAPDSIPEEDEVVRHRPRVRVTRQVMHLEDSMPDYVPPEDIDDDTLNEVVMPMWDIFVPGYRQIYECQCGTSFRCVYVFTLLPLPLPAACETFKFCGHAQTTHACMKMIITITFCVIALCVVRGMAIAMLIAVAIRLAVAMLIAVAMRLAVVMRLAIAMRLAVTSCIQNHV